MNFLDKRKASHAPDFEGFIRLLHHAAEHGDLSDGDAAKFNQIADALRFDDGRIERDLCVVTEARKLKALAALLEERRATYEKAEEVRNQFQGPMTDKIAKAMTKFKTTAPNTLGSTANRQILDELVSKRDERMFQLNAAREEAEISFVESRDAHQRYEEIRARYPLLIKAEA